MTFIEFFFWWYCGCIFGSIYGKLAYHYGQKVSNEGIKLSDLAFVIFAPFILPILIIIEHVEVRIPDSKKKLNKSEINLKRYEQP